jgi:outer membrane protein assembly factor BamB
MKTRLGTWLLAGAISAAPALANDWCQWRGPEQNGVSLEKNLPDKWTPEGENLAWAAPVGGMSCPIVMDGRVYTFTRVGEVPAGAGLTATVDPGPKTQEALTCMDEKTGKVLWQHLNNMFETDAPFHRLGWSSPVGDPETGNVYAMGTQCTLVCCDGKTGKLIWHHQMTGEYGMISTFGGRTSSPAVDQDQLFITGVSFGWGNNAGSAHRIFAFDKKTGRLNWTQSTGGIPVDAPYNTPVVNVINGERLVMFQAGDGSVNAFQARTGKRVWRYLASKHGWNASIVSSGNFVYFSYDLDNLNSNRLGGVVCLDASKVTDGEPAVVWKREGIEAGFPSPTLAEGTLYVMSDNAQLYAIDAATGKIKYHHGMGTIGKASPVYGDGKLYISDGNGRFAILKPEKTKFKVLSQADFMDKPGREYVIFGSPAISDGHVFLATATMTYCIGPRAFTKQEVSVPPMAAEPPAQGGPPAQIQVVPADVVLKPGEKVDFTVRGFDDMGRFTGEVKAEKWSVGKLQLPPPPIRPKALMRPNSAAAAQGAKLEAPKAPAPSATPPTTRPAAIGNLEGQVDADGVYTAAQNVKTFQGGGVIARTGNVSGTARVRVFPPLPWKIDFEKSPEDLQPLTWIDVGMKPALKFVVRKEPGNPSNKVLVKVTDIPLFARARTYFGMPEQTNYTIQSDVKVTETVFHDNGTEVHRMPDVGVIDSRYVLELKGSDQTLNLYGWGAAIPRNELLPGLATHKAIQFPWKANIWYTEKLMVQQMPDKAVLKGKVWERGNPEPKEWTIDLEDPTPNTHGPAGLWGFSNDLEIYYDNILVTPNGRDAVAKGHP